MRSSPASSAHGLPLLTIVIVATLGPPAAAVQDRTAGPLLERWRQAARHRSRGPIHTLRLVRLTSGGGLAGTERLVLDDRSRMSASREHAGLDRTEVVLTGREARMRDWNGAVLSLTGPDLRAVIAERFEAAFPWLGHDAGYDAVVRPDDAQGNHVISLTPAGGAEITYTLHPTSSLPIRAERRAGPDRVVTTYLGWKEDASGLRLPSEVRVERGDPRNTVRSRLESAEVDAPVPDGTFAAPRPTPDARLPGSGIVRDIPIKRLSRFLLVPVRINDRGDPLWFLWDTGASLTVLHRDRASRLGIARHGDLGLGTSDGSTGMSIAEGVSYDIGGARLVNQFAGVVALESFEAGLGLPFGGILGYDFTSRFVVEVDFEAARMTLHEPGAFRGDGRGTAIPVRVEDKNAFAEGAVVLPSGRIASGLFDIDTGETKGLYLNGPFVKRNRLLEAAVDVGRKTGGRATEKAFTNSIGVKGRLEEFRLGPFRFKDPPVGLSLAEGGGFVANPDYAGIVGNEILGRFRLWLDLSRKRLILKPNARYGEPFTAPRSFGLLLIAQGADLRKFVVARVRPGSPAERAGFQQGDTIVAIDGRPARGASLEEVQSRFEREGGRYDVEVARGDGAVHLAGAVRLVPQ